MVITYHGLGMFKVSFGEMTLAFSPIGKQSTTKTARFGSDIVLVSLEHPDANGVDMVAHGDKKPFEARGPGEYEVGGVLIKGYPTKTAYGGVERINTAYLVSLENMLLLYLGALSSKELPPGLREQLDEVDILFVPIGGEGVLGPDDAHDLAVSIEPHIVLPMFYDARGNDGNDGGSLKAFLREDAKENGGAVERLTVKRKDLEGKQNEIVVLSS